MKLTGISVYPVKSLGGIDVAAAAVHPWGLDGDRRWLVLLPDGRFLTARDEHRMLGVTAAPTADGLRLTGLDGSTLDVATPVDGPSVPTSVSRLDSVRAAAPDAHAWLSAQLGRDVRLAWQDDPYRRVVAEN
ncbi:MAG: sulfurase, partial [Catenulispora sp.]|nr:sulfurase [Catenulispora sp.]